MASSGEDQSSEVVHGTPGELVWVHRRYGSWWPAQILVPDQLPEGSSRKPGLPFKLLGREEDPIVEWYNLEKSKRVKAFRCGDFDDWIEKAEASASLYLSKKPSRNARKDVAILQAIELEKASLELDQLNFSANFGAQDEDHHYVDISSTSASRRTNDAQKGSETSSFLGVQKEESFVTMFNVPLIPEENNSAGVSIIAHGVSSKTQVSVAGPSSQSSHVDAISIGGEEPNESYSTSFGAPDVRCSQRMEIATSEWGLKGQRKCRSRKMGTDGKAEEYKAGMYRGRLLPGSSRNMAPSRVHRSLITDCDGNLVKSRSIGEILSAEHFGWNWNVHRRESHEIGPTADMAALKRQIPRRHIGSPSLYDVTVRVKDNQRSQGVPFISLASKINSRPVTGHPITVEVLDDGFCDDQLAVSCAQAGYVVYGRRPRGRPPRSDNWSQGQCSVVKPEKKGNSLKKFRKLSSLITDSYGDNHHQEFEPLVDHESLCGLRPISGSLQ